MERFAKLADLFYEAALEPELWAGVIEELAACVGGSSVAVLSSYEAPNEARLMASVRYDLQNWKRVQAEHASPDTNRYIELIGGTKVGEVLWPRAILSRTEWTDDPITQKFLKPEGLVDGLSVPLQQSRRGFAAVALFNTKSYTPKDVGLLRSLTTDLSRAFRMSKMVAETRSIQNAATAAIDAISSGVVLINERGRVIVANSASRMTFTRGDGISLGPLGQILVADRSAGIRLSGMVRAASASATRGHRRWSTSDRPRTVSGALSVPRPSGSRPYTIVVCPIRSARLPSLPIGPEATVCVLFITDPDVINVVEASDLSAAYGLTPAEAQVVAHLLAGHSLHQAARTMGVTINSAKTLLHRAFDRCQVRRQSDLIALVLRGPLGFL
jgi:DNA-binding CsgD family transcriptional regulator